MSCIALSNVSPFWRASNVRGLRFDGRDEIRALSLLREGGKLMMRMMKRGLLCASLLGLLGISVPAWAQRGSSQDRRNSQQDSGDQSYRSSDDDESSGRGTSPSDRQRESSGRQTGTSAPQFWIADATIFSANAWNTATIMSREAMLNIQNQDILASQARFLTNAIDRSLSDIKSLQQNALNTNVNAVPVIRIAAAQLQAARTQAQDVAQSTSQGQLGPAFRATLQSTIQHLENAQQVLQQVGQAYQAPELASLQPGYGAPSGQFGGQQGGGQFAGPPQQFGGPQQQGGGQFAGPPQQQWGGQFGGPQQGGGQFGGQSGYGSPYGGMQQSGYRGGQPDSFNQPESSQGGQPSGRRRTY
jgi:hypothetical protein